MPTRVNGIGTTYIGQSEADSRHAVCEQCKQAAVLSSYNTRLWFTVIFIPLIPLQRKRVIDYCPLCTNHKVLALHEWSRIKQESTAKTASAVAANPASAQATIEHHVTLVAFSNHQEAAAVAQKLERDFANNFEVCAYLGDHYLRLNQYDKAEAALARAVRLSPGHVAATEDLIVARALKGDVSGAKSLLAGYTQKAQAENALGARPFLVLAEACHGSQAHSDALNLYSELFKHFPQLAKDKALRKQVRVSEKAAGQVVLPAQSMWRNTWFRAAALVGAVAAVLFGVNYYLATHQMLYVLNASPSAVTIAFDGGNAGEFAAGAEAEVTIGEGMHEALITRKDGSVSTVRFEITNTLGQRVVRDSVFVLNVDGLAGVLFQDVTYVRKGNELEDAAYSVFYGKPFMAFRDVEYIFEDPPEEIMMEEHSKKEVRRAVTSLGGDPMLVCDYIPQNSPDSTYLNFCEVYLPFHPAHGDLLALYATIGMRAGLQNRCMKFLETGIDKQPLSMEWHRTYQAMGDSCGRHEELVKRYDDILRTDPLNSDLLYLRARLCDNSDEAIAGYDRAIEADSDNPYPLAAKSIHVLQRGDFDTARALAEQALRCKPVVDLAEHVRDQVDWALGEFSRLEAQARAEAEESLVAQYQLLTVLVAQGRLEEAQQAHEAFKKIVLGYDPDDVDQLALASELKLRFLRREWQQVLKLAGTLDDPGTMVAWQLSVYMELHEFDAAEQLLQQNTDLQSIDECLLMSIGFASVGNAAKAAHWRGMAVEMLADGDSGEARIAELLQKGGELRFDDVNSVFFADCTRKAAVLVALAQDHAALREPLMALAAKLNFDRHYPHDFLQGLCKTD